MTTGSPRGRIVILEGLPGSGKSTTAHLLRLHLQDVGLDARWWWEHEQPHPIFDYSVIQEALDDGLLQAGLFERAIGNWQKVVRKAEWVVLDGLKPGDRVIADGWQKVRPGQKVNAQPAPAVR